VSTPSELRGLKVLVVEDNYLVAELVRSLFEECGSETVGPAARVDSALALIDEDGDLDGAVLDINLAGEYCFPIAERLRQRGVPFFFLTGYDEGQIVPAQFRDVPRLAKPFDNYKVQCVAAQIFAR
jgi:CheY-like chemotaxis protein